MSNPPSQRLEEAEKIAREIVSKHSGHHMQSTISWVDRPQLVTAITSALISAEQRGAQREREAWLPIETAPKDGTEIIGYRRDCDQILVRYTSMDAFMTDREIEAGGWDEETTSKEDWFFADFVQGGRLQPDEAPTHWQPLPPPPDCERATSSGVPKDAFKILEDLRERGWAVAVHNDYWLSGGRYTFWLFTHRWLGWVKGEGLTDEDALRKAQGDALKASGSTSNEVGALAPSDVSHPDAQQLDTPKSGLAEAIEIISLLADGYVEPRSRARDFIKKHGGSNDAA